MTAASVDPVTIGIAGYAAAVATIGIGFQWFSWRRNTQTRVEIKLSLQELLEPGNDAATEEVVRRVGT
jgi:hypothetical protein